MKAFSSFSTREQGLVIIAAILCAAFTLWQFALNPVIKGKADAKRSHAQALRDMDIMRRAVPLLGDNVAVTPRAAFNRSAAIAQAGKSGLTISRVQPAPNGDIQIWFDDAPSLKIYGFLSALSRDYAVNIERADMRRRDGGLVSAQINLRAAP